MFQSKVARLVAGVVAAVVIAGASSWWAMEASASPAQPTVIDQGYAPLPASATSGMGVTLSPLTAAQQLLTLLPLDQVISLANTRVGDLAGQASSITASLGSFTDSEYGNVDSAGVLHLIADGVPAFVINYSGLSIPSRGGTTATDSQQAVVINAVTGEVIEDYVYP